MTSTKVRAFVAICCPGDLREELASAAKKIGTGEAKVRWSAADKLHLTMKFLGDVEPAQLAEVFEACRRAAADSPRQLRVEVTGFELFPSERRPRLVAARVEPTDELAGLAARLEEEMAAIGFPPEGRRFRPHVSVGRIDPRAGADGLARSLAGAKSDFDGFDNSEIVVFQSELNPGGAVHTVLGRIGLGGAEGE